MLFFKKTKYNLYIMFLSEKRNSKVKKEKKSLFQIGTKIKARRKALGLTQEKLAELIDCSFKTIGNIENDNTIPDTRQVINLCDVLDMSFDELFSDVLKKREEQFSMLPESSVMAADSQSSEKNYEDEEFPYLLKRVIVKPIRSASCIQLQEYISARLSLLDEASLKAVKSLTDCFLENK